MTLRVSTCVCVFVLSASSGSAQTPPVPPAPPPAVQAETNKSAVTFYGFARLDLIFDDSRVNSFQSPTLVRPEPEGAENRGNFTMHPRLTRFGVNYGAPSSDTGPVVSGRLEIDFQNGGSNSRAIPRYRLAYLQVTWGAHSLIAGQTWDTISPLLPTVNADTVMWNVGNMGDRRPQLRYSYEPKAGFNARGSIGLTGAIDNLDADANGIPDGEASQLPNVQGRLGYNTANGKASAGVSSHFARMQPDTPVGGRANFDSHSIGADVDLRFTPNVSLKGEVWRGSNLADFRGGIGQALNAPLGREIDAHGGWLELGLRRGRYGFTTGYLLDDPDDADLPAAGASHNRAAYITNQFRLVPALTLGVDYVNWRTQYKTGPDGTDNRVNGYFTFTF
jgi:hypothetical protein